MNYIDLHAHMTSRTTDDYEKMSQTGCVAVSEPAFWAGYDRVSPVAFADYFKHLTTFEPGRALGYGIRHFTWLCLNAKEGDDRELAKGVLPLILPYLDHPNVLGIGEVGLNRVTKNEIATFTDHVKLAVEHSQMMQVHTPHLEDKHKGTKIIVDILVRDNRINPTRVLIDHVEEHTIAMVLAGGFWAGITLYPESKVSSDRAIDMLEKHGTERICVGSGCDWGPSNPIAIADFIMQMRRRGYSEQDIKKIVFDNPAQFLGQSPKFNLPPYACE